MTQMIRVIALLDYPRPSSFGRVPFIEQMNDGLLRVRGLVDRPHMVLEKLMLEKLITEGHALKLDIDPIPAISSPKNLLAGWIGSEFKRKAKALRVPAPIMTTSRTGKIRNTEGKILGHIWLDYPKNIYRLQKQWIDKTALRVFKNKKSKEAAKLAELMEWVLPDADETCAATWFSRPTKEEKAVELRWLVRLKRDMGKSCSEVDLERRFRQLDRRILEKSKPPMTKDWTTLTEDKNLTEEKIYQAVFDPMGNKPNSDELRL